jgi:hypothetical protein
MNGRILGRSGTISGKHQLMLSSPPCTKMYIGAEYCSAACGKKATTPQSGSMTLVDLDSKGMRTHEGFINGIEIESRSHRKDSVMDKR